MRKKWLLLSLSAVILLPVVTLAVVVIYIGTTDLGQHRDLIAEKISKATGRRLSLNGEFDLNISMTPSVLITRLSFANAPWASQAEMLTVERVEAEIELLPLIRGDIHVPKFHLEGVRTIVETDSRGTSNWVLVEADADQVDTPRADKDGDFKAPWIGDMQISKLELVYQDGQSGQTVSAKLDHATVGSPDPNSPVVIYVIGSVDNKPVEINGQLILPMDLKGDSVDVPIELHVRALGVKADASGSLTGAIAAPAIDLAVEANAANLKQLRQVFGEVVPEVEPVKLVVDVKADQGQPVLFKLNAIAGKGQLDSTMTVRREGARPQIEGNIEISDLDVARLWAPMFADRTDRPAVKKPDTSPAKTSQGLDQPIPLDWLQSFDANVSLSASNIKLPQADIKSLQSRFVIDDRRFNIADFDLATNAGAVKAGLVLDARSKVPGLQLDFDTTEIELAKIPPLADNKHYSGSKAKAVASLVASGNSVASLIETFQGSAQLDYDNPKQKEKLTVKLQRKAEKKTADNKRLDITADGLLDGQAIELRGSIIPPKGLLIAGKPYQIDLAVQAYGANGNITGTAINPFSMEGFDLGIEASAADLTGLRKVLGEGVPAVGQTKLNARLKTQKLKLQLSDLQLMLGDARIDGWLKLDTSTAIPDVQTELAFTDFNLDKLLPAQQKAATPQAKPATKKAAGDKVFSNEPLPFEYLSQATIKATLRVANLVQDNARLKQAEISIDMHAEKLSVSLLKFSPARGELVGDFVVDASVKGAPKITIKFKAPHIELGETIVAQDGTAAVEGPLATDISLQAQGNSLAQLMATLNGNVNLLMEQGSADAKALDMFVGGLSAIVGTIFTEQSSKTQINCAICDLKLSDGIVTPQLAVLDTQYSTVFVEGQVDLKNEQLNIKVSPQAKGVTLSMAFPVRVEGKLSKPGMEVEKTGALLKAGELWANVVYPPSLLLKFSELGDGKQNPCVSMVAEKGGIPIIEDVGKVVEGTVKGVGSAVKGVGGAVKGLGSGLGLDKLVDAVKEEDDSTAPADGDAEDEDIFDSDF